MLDAQFWFGFIMGSSIFAGIYLVGLLFVAIHKENQEEKERLEREQERNDYLASNSIG